MNFRFLKCKCLFILYGNFQLHYEFLKKLRTKFYFSTWIFLIICVDFLIIINHQSYFINQIIISNNEHLR